MLILILVNLGRRGMSSPLQSSQVSTVLRLSETKPVLKCGVFGLAELLELRSQSQRDLQRLQHCPVLRLLLPAQGLGEAPPNLRPRPARPEQAAGSAHGPIGSRRCQEPRRRAQPGPREDFGHHLPVLHPGICDSNRNERTLKGKFWFSPFD